MSLRVDKGLSGVANFFALLANTYPQHSQLLIPGNVSVVSVAADATGAQNTVVELAGIEGSRVIGTASVNFSRHELAAQGLAVHTLPADLEDAQQYVDAYIEAGNFLADEIDTVEFNNDTGDGTVVLTVRAIDGAFTVAGTAEIVISESTEELADLVGEGQLDGFDFQAV